MIIYYLIRLEFPKTRGTIYKYEIKHYKKCSIYYIILYFIPILLYNKLTFMLSTKQNLEMNHQNLQFLRSYIRMKYLSTPELPLYILYRVIMKRVLTRKKKNIKFFRKNKWIC